MHYVSKTSVYSRSAVTRSSACPRHPFFVFRFNSGPLLPPLCQGSPRNRVKVSRLPGSFLGFAEFVTLGETAKSFFFLSFLLFFYCTASKSTDSYLSFHLNGFLFLVRVQVCYYLFVQMCAGMIHAVTLFFNV